MFVLTLGNISLCIMLGRDLPHRRISSADNLAHHLQRPTFILPPEYLLSRQGIETGTSSSGLPQETHKSTRNCGQLRHIIFFFPELYLSKILKNKQTCSHLGRHFTLSSLKFYPLLFNILSTCLLINCLKNLLPFLCGFFLGGWDVQFSV